MRNLKQIVVSTKNFVLDHKVAFAIVGTALVCGKMNRAALNDHNEFLKEHDLYETYYKFEEK